MSDDSIPDDLRRFILTAIPSVPYLEAVLQFQRQPQVHQSAADIARALYIPAETATALLQALCAAGILETEAGAFRYAPGEALGATLDRVAEAYGRDLIGVTALIHDTTQRNAQRFAEAFRLRRRRT